MTDNIKAEKTYLPSEWLVKFANIDSEYVNDMFAYYQQAFITYHMSSDLELTPYRSTLKDIVTNNIKINEIGVIIPDVNDDAVPESVNSNITPTHGLWPSGSILNPLPLNVFSTIAYRRPIDGMLNFMVLQYEEDKLLDYMVEKYNIQNTAKLVETMKACGKSDLQISFFSELNSSQADNQLIGEVTAQSTFVFEKCMFNYNYKQHSIFIGLGKYADEYFIVKCKTPMSNPALPYIHEKFKHGNFLINTRHKGVILHNLAQIETLSFSDGGWTIPI